MNWMTSGRKRVQRSQKIKELRAKHFAKVAVDRAKALPQPPRGGPPTARQSSDVSRLQSRWMQTSQVGHPGAPGKVAVSVERTVTSETTPGHNTIDRTPPVDIAALGSATPEGHFQAGVLNLDVTPPLNASRSYYGAGGVPRNTSVDAVSMMERTPSPTRVQHSNPLTSTSQQKQQCQVPPSRSGWSAVSTQNTLPVERRQLFFGTGSTAAEDSGGTYEAQLLGSESDANAVPNDTTFSQIHYDGATSAATDQEEAPAGQWARFGQKMGNPLRFFNSGAEVEHNGSPMSSHLTLPSLMAAMAAGPMSSLSHDAVGVDAAPLAPGTTDTTAGVGRGMPSFSINGLLGSRGLPTTPPEELKEAKAFPDGSDEANIPEKDHHSIENPAFGHERAVPRKTTKAAHLHVQGHPEFECLGQHTLKEVEAEGSPIREGHDMGEIQHVSEASLALPREETQPAAFELLARTWGLFGGALNAPPDTTAAAAPSAAPDPNHSHSQVPEHFQTEDECDPQAEGRDVISKVMNSQDSAMRQISLGTTQEPQQEQGVSPTSPTPNIDHDQTRSDSPELVMLWESSYPGGEIDLTQAEASSGKLVEQGSSSGAPRSPGYQPVSQGIEEVDSVEEIHMPNQHTHLGTVAALTDRYNPGPDTLLIAERLGASGSEKKITERMQGADEIELELPEKLPGSVEDRKGSNLPGIGSGPGIVKRVSGIAPPSHRSLSEVCTEDDATRTNMFGDKAGSQESKTPGHEVPPEEQDNIPVIKTPANISTDMEQSSIPLQTVAAPIAHKSSLAHIGTRLDEAPTPNRTLKRPRGVGQTGPGYDGDPAQGRSSLICARGKKWSVKSGHRQLNLESLNRRRDAVKYGTMPREKQGVGPTRRIVGSEDTELSGTFVDGEARKDDASTIVWYRTIVACLLAAS